MEDRLPEFPSFMNRLGLDSEEENTNSRDSINSIAEEKKQDDDVAAILSSKKARASIIHLDLPPVGDTSDSDPDRGNKRGKSFVVRDSVVAINDALAELHELVALYDFDF